MAETDGSLQTATYAIISVMFAMGTASFFLRFYCRALITHAFGWDDVLAIFLLLVNTMQQAILYLFLHYGCGLHVELLTAAQLENITLWLFIEEIFYMFTHWTIKMTFLIFYIRLSQEPLFRRMCFATMFLNTACMLVNWSLAVFQCIPLDAYFHPALHPDATCINSNILLMGPSVLNMITDVIILVLPIHTIWKLNMSRRKKVSVTAVIAFGGSSVIVAACRFIVLAQLASTTDISYVLGHMVIVAGIEIQLAIIAVNMPSMKVLFTRRRGGESSGDRYVKQEGSGYKLSSLSGKGASSSARARAQNWAAPVADVSITRHIAGDSEEELWRKDNADKVYVTKTVVVDSFPAS